MVCSSDQPTSQQCKLQQGTQLGKLSAKTCVCGQAGNLYLVTHRLAIQAGNGVESNA